MSRRWPFASGMGRSARGRVVDDEAGNTGFGVHHPALGEFEADVARVEEVEEEALQGEVGTGAVAGREAGAAVMATEELSTPATYLPMKRTIFSAMPSAPFAQWAWMISPSCVKRQGWLLTLDGAKRAGSRR